MNEAQTLLMSAKRTPRTAKVNRLRRPLWKPRKRRRGDRGGIAAPECQPVWGELG
jgi:hypothetical protein